MHTQEIVAQLNDLGIEVTDDADEYIIQKEDKIIPQVGHCYSVEVESYIVHPFEGFTLHDNWNNGIAPTDIRMNMEVLQILGKMIQVHCIGQTDRKLWDGWLPIKSVRIFRELTV